MNSTCFVSVTLMTLFGPFNSVIPFNFITPTLGSGKCTMNPGEFNYRSQPLGRMKTFFFGSSCLFVSEFNYESHPLTFIDVILALGSLQLDIG